MGPPPWEDIAVPLAPDGGHYVNACSTYPYIYIYIYVYVHIHIHPTKHNHFILKKSQGLWAPSLGGHCCAFSP